VGCVQKHIFNISDALNASLRRKRRLETKRVTCYGRLAPTRCFGAGIQYWEVIIFVQSFLK
jgi:hypothetical protein